MELNGIETELNGIKLYFSTKVINSHSISTKGVLGWELYEKSGINTDSI